MARRSTADDAYLRESILQPNAKIVQGYQANVMAGGIVGVQGQLELGRHDRCADRLPEEHQPGGNRHAGREWDTGDARRGERHRDAACRPFRDGNPLTSHYVDDVKAPAPEYQGQVSRMFCRGRRGAPYRHCVLAGNADRYRRSSHRALCRKVQLDRFDKIIEVERLGDEPGETARLPAREVSLRMGGEDDDAR